jgi:hypothetical protein
LTASGRWFDDGGLAVNETVEAVGGLGVAVLVALAGRLTGGGAVVFQFLAAPFRAGLPWRLDGTHGAATGSRDAGQRE